MRTNFRRRWSTNSPLSDDAERYYKSGKSFLYRTLPFWIASLADRVIVLLVPIIVVLIPGLRLVPGLYRWRVRSRIYKMYGALIAIEREALADPEPAARDALIDRVDAIENAVNQMKMPLAYADQFYVLREHIGFVRHRLELARDAALGNRRIARPTRQARRTDQGAARRQHPAHHVRSDLRCRPRAGRPTVPGDKS